LLLMLSLFSLFSDVFFRGRCFIQILSVCRCCMCGIFCVEPVALCYCQIVSIIEVS
jgi:hypothetical protein